MLAETILALMLAVGPKPGASPYSVVATSAADKPCAGFAPLCRRPRYDAWHKSLVRQENYTEALSRYWTIATAIAEVAGDDDQLARLLLTITLHESAFRRDIHSGLGKWALGDAGRSWSIVQANLGRGAPKGFELVGVGYEATHRAISWAAGHLRRCATSSAAATLGCYGGVRSSHAGIASRRRSFERFLRQPPALDEHVRAVLGLIPLSPPSPTAWPTR